MTRTNRRILSVALAIVMALGLVGSALAAGTPFPVETPIWFTDANFTSEESYPVPYPCPTDNLNGRNTIQKVFYSDDDNLYIVIHPQYFGGDDSDDDANATAMAAIVDILVYDPVVADDYVPCATGNLLTIPQSYIQQNTNDENYLKFIVDFELIDFCNDGKKYVTWEPEAYLKIGLFPPEPCSVAPPIPATEIEGLDETFTYTTPIWFKDADLVYEEDDVIGGWTIDGENTVQKLFHSDIDDTYYLIIHPEYFGSINHDAEDGADAMVTIVDLLVYDPAQDAYAPCLTGNLITVPDSYVQYNGDKQPYLEFIVDLHYIDFCNDTQTHLAWKPAYLSIGVYDPPPCGVA
jgi:hypothetical protein